MSTTLSQPAPRPAVTATALTPPGYRRTEVGTIPCDWGVSSVGAEFRIQLGKMLDAAKNTGVLKPYIGNRSVQWGRIDLDGIATVPMTMSDLQRFLLRRGDLLVCEGGEIGRAAIWKDLIPECYYQKAIHRLRPIRTYDAYLMMSLLQLWASTGYLANYVTQTSIAHLPKDKLEVVPLPVPPPAEQHAIAEALSDVDGLLRALEALVAKKRAIKQAAMQQLLTGKTRLPGFSGEWLTKRLGEIAELHRQNVVPAISGDTLFVHFSLPAYDEGRCPVMELGKEIGSNKFHVPENTVLVSKLNPRIIRVWAPASVGSNAVASTEFLVLTPRDNVSRIFLLVLCLSPRFCEQMGQLATGTTGSHQRISPPEAMKIEIWVPTNPTEQRAIAAVLSDMDAEIAALEHRRDKTRAVKQGMMQQLLTGRVRLVQPEMAAEQSAGP